MGDGAVGQLDGDAGVAAELGKSMNLYGLRWHQVFWLGIFLACVSIFGVYATPIRNRGISSIEGIKCPAHVTLSPDSARIYVTNLCQYNQVVVLDAASQSTVASISVGKRPLGMAIKPDGKTAYVANAGDHTVSVIDLETHQVTTTLAVGQDPFSVFVSPDGDKVYVAGKHSISVIRTADHTVTATLAVNSIVTGVALTPDGARLYIAVDDKIQIISTHDLGLTATVDVGGTLTGVAITGDGRRAVATASDGVSYSFYLLISTSDHAVSPAHNLGDYLSALALSPDGRRAYLGDGLSGVLYGVDLHTDALLGELSLTNNNMTVSPDGSRLYVTQSADSRVAVIVLPAPTVAAVLPNRGPAAGGTRIALSGTNFSQATGITVGDQPCERFSVDSDTQATCVTPVSNPGRAPVLIATEFGTNAPNVFFTYVAPATVPGAPTSVTATPGNGQVILNFTAPASDGGAAITDYLAEYKKTADTNWIAFSDGTSTTPSITVTGLSNGVSYDFRVSALNAAGTGAASGVVSVKPESPGVCGASAVVTAAFTPTRHLCNSGSASRVVGGMGTWNWSCTSPTGNASCTAPQASAPSGGGASGVATGSVDMTNLWQVNPAKTAGFIPVTGHVASPSTPPPAGLSFPQGLLQFQLDSGTPGSSATVTLNYPEPLPAGTVYWKFGPEPGNAVPHWYVFSAAVLSSDRKSITLTLTDGGAGDSDSTLGTITDPGGPAVEASAAQATPIPTLGEWAMVLLVSLLVWVSKYLSLPPHPRRSSHSHSTCLTTPPTFNLLGARI